MKVADPVFKAVLGLQRFWFGFTMNVVVSKSSSFDLL